jgi:hypothetical protein
MKYEDVTMNYFFQNHERITDQTKSFETSENFSELRNSISKKEPLMEWNSVLSQVLKKCPELLELRFKDILIGGWRKYQQLEQYFEQGKTNPEVTFSVPLVTHSIVSEHHPKIEIRFNEIQLGQIDFSILLKLELSGIILNIKGGEIEGVKAGNCKCKGSVACEGIVLFEDSSETFEF